MSMLSQSSEAADVYPRNAWMLVAGREITTKFLTKSFIVGTLLTVLIIVGSIALPAYLSSRGSTTTVAVTTDEAKALAEKVGRAVTAAEPKDRVEIVRASDQGAAETLLREGNADVLLTRSGNGWQAASKDDPSKTFAQHTRQVLSAEVLAEVAGQAGTSADEVASRSAVSTRSLTGKDGSQRAVGFVLGMAFAILFYMSVVVYGMQIAQSVLEEKQSRIVEILAAAIPVRQLLIGKVVGNTVMAVGQIVLYLGVGFVGVAFTPFSSMMPSLSGALVWYIVFFLAGFLALACLWAVAGSLATRAEDLQQTANPLVMLLMTAFFASLFVTGTWATVVSYIPVASSMVMPTRLVQGDAQWWEAVISLLLTVSFGVLLTLLGERMYRNSLMQTSSRMSFKEAFKATD